MKSPAAVARSWLRRSPSAAGQPAAKKGAAADSELPAPVDTVIMPAAQTVPA